MLNARVLKISGKKVFIDSKKKYFKSASIYGMDKKNEQTFKTILFRLIGLWQEIFHAGKPTF